MGVNTKVTSVKLTKCDLDTAVFLFSLTENFYSWFSKSPCVSGPPHYQGFAITVRLTTLGMTPLDEWSALHRDLYLTTHIGYKWQTSMAPSGFKPAIPASERPQTHSWDSAACGIGVICWDGNMNTSHERQTVYESCPDSVRPFWISREPFKWPCCNLAHTQRRLYYASVNTHSPVGLVSRQWDAVDWACVLWDCHIRNDRTSR